MSDLGYRGCSDFGFLYSAEFVNSLAKDLAWLKETQYSPQWRVPEALPDKPAALVTARKEVDIQCSPLT